MNIRDYAIQCIKDEAQAVLDLIPQLDEHFDRAVELMLHCKGRLSLRVLARAGTSVQKLLPPSRQQVLPHSISTHWMYSMATWA